MSADLDWRDRCQSAGGIDWRHFALLKTDGGVQQLTPKQWSLFSALRNRRGEIVGDDVLITAVWPGQVADGDRHALCVLVHGLRAALAGSRFAVHRHRCRGYELIAAPRREQRAQQSEHGLAL